MRKITHILQVPIDAVTMEEAVNRVMGLMNDGKPHIVCTPNPEIVMEAQKDRGLMEILRAADLVVPDGVGVVWASKYSPITLTERVAGYDLVLNLFSKMKDTEYTAYFLGGAPGVAQVAAKKMMKKYPGLKVVGVHNGYFDSAEEKKIIADIKKLSPSILLVGLGAPKQEKWIYENMRIAEANICIGVGGCFDVMAGNVNRAPMAFRKLGLEWFYRLLKQPSRFWRMLRLPKFVLVVLKTYFLGKKAKK